MKIPPTCGDCTQLKNDITCGFYDKSFFVVDSKRKPPTICPKRHVARFEWLCGNAIRERTSPVPPNGFNLWYDLHLDLTVNNDVMATIDDKLGEPKEPPVDYSYHATFRVGQKYRLEVSEVFPDQVEVYLGDNLVEEFRLDDGVNLILINENTGTLAAFQMGFQFSPESAWRTLFEVIMIKGKVWTLTDFQTKERQKATLEDRVAALEKRLGI